MPLEDSIRARLSQLIEQSRSLSVGNEHDQCTDPRQRAGCVAWLTAAHNAVSLVVPASSAPYRQRADRVVGGNPGFHIHHSVGDLAAVLQALLQDADAGLLSSVADQACAETFDDFLDHAEHYLRNSRTREAGVIVGVVFEDSVRRVCRKLNIDEKDVKLDALISELVRRDELTAVKAKRARAAADVRTKATHAQWDEFEASDVKTTIELTREFISSKLA